MERYHLAWLSVHPERTQEWLKQKLAEGFQVHHIDGDHFNDDPHNLLLVDGVDHLRLHSGSIRAGIASWRDRQRKPKKALAEDSVGREVYVGKASDDRPWKDYVIEFYGGVKPEPDLIWGDIAQKLQWRAKRFAKRNDLPWPPAHMSAAR